MSNSGQIATHVRNTKKATAQDPEVGNQTQAFQYFWFPLLTHKKGCPQTRHTQTFTKNTDIGRSQNKLNRLVQVASFGTEWSCQKSLPPGFAGSSKMCRYIQPLPAPPPPRFSRGSSRSACKDVAFVFIYGLSGPNASSRAWLLF